MSWLLVAGAGVTSAAPADKLWHTATVELTEARTQLQQRRSRSHAAVWEISTIYVYYLHRANK